MTSIIQHHNAIFNIQKNSITENVLNIKDIYYDNNINFTHKLLLNIKVNVPIKYLNNIMIIKYDKLNIKGAMFIDKILYYDWIQNIIGEKYTNFIKGTNNYFIYENIEKFTNIINVIFDSNNNNNFNIILIQISNCKEIPFDIRYELIERLKQMYLNICSLCICIKKEYNYIKLLSKTITSSFKIID